MRSEALQKNYVIGGHDGCITQDQPPSQETWGKMSQADAVRWLRESNLEVEL